MNAIDGIWGSVEWNEPIALPAEREPGVRYATGDVAAEPQKDGK